MLKESKDMFYLRFCNDLVFIQERFYFLVVDITANYRTITINKPARISLHV